MDHSEVRVAEGRYLWAFLLPLFLFSGATGLVYEVVWTRMMGLVFGTTALAVSTVLAAFMGGLALGSFVVGRFVDRYTNPLRLYAMLEAGVAVFALVFPLILTGLDQLYGAIYGAAGPNYGMLSLVRFVFSFAILLIPSTLMGGTLPALTKVLIRRKDTLGAGIGALYSINTWGGVVGSFAAGFLLLPSLGVHLTTLVAAGVNLIVAGIAFVLSTRPSARPTLHGERERGPVVSEAASTAISGSRIVGGRRAIEVAVLFAACASGLAALIYEVAWTKALSLFLGPTVYAFTAMLTTFLTGLALGSLIFSRFLDRRTHLAPILVALQGAVCILALLLTPVFMELPHMFMRIFSSWGDSWVKLQLGRFLMAFAVMLLPTVVLGAIFPLICKMFVTRISTVGRSVSSVYASNTVGAIAGSLLAGFVLIPVIGTQNTIVVAALVNLIIAILFLMPLEAGARHRIRIPVGIALVAVFVIANLMTPSWNKQLMVSGVHVYVRDYLEAGTVAGVTGESELVFFKESPGGLVSVSRKGRNVIMAINGKVEASNLGDMPTQSLLSHIPLVCHGGAKSALVIGLGSGVTLGSAEQHPLEWIECVEITEPVIEASDFFLEENNRCLEDERLTMLVADGRNHLVFSPRTYDCIISEPSNPWISGMSNLFTREFFTECKEKLNPGGVMGQWVQNYMMSQEDVEIILATFLSVFEHVTLWWVGEGDLVLVGSDQPIVLDYQKYLGTLGLPSVKADLERIGNDNPWVFLANYICDQDEIRTLIDEGTTINTDDRNILEFSAPRSLYSPTTAGVIESLKRVLQDPLVSILDSESVPGEKQSQVHSATKIARTAREAVFESIINRARGNLDKALNEAAYAYSKNRLDPNARNAFYALVSQLAGHYEASGKLDMAAEQYIRATRVKPEEPWAYERLGIVLSHMGRLEEAAEALGTAARLDPQLVSTKVALGTVYGQMGNFRDALALLEEALFITPKNVKALNNLGAVMALNGRYLDASEAWKRALRIDPRNATARGNLEKVASRLGS